jgi:KipI family sensor histidine kinase inhibitor
MIIKALGDAHLIISLGDRIDPGIHQEVLGLTEGLKALRHPGILSVMPAYTEVLLAYDPLRLLESEIPALVAEAGRRALEVKRPPGRRFEIPVLYGGDYGPDLKDLARLKGLSEEEVVAIHTSRTYRLYGFGFIPGFLYLGILDERIRLGRLETPRLAVAAGSVGIAGEQTGIYPRVSPGGWRIIGRSPVEFFDPKREEPTPFRPGDELRFVPLDEAGFLEIQANRDFRMKSEVMD